MLWKRMFFTGIYTGYFPVAPGTAGTLLAAVIYILEFAVFGTSGIFANIFVVFIMLYPSIKFCDAGEEYFDKKDPQQVVLDEMMGFWVSVLFFPFDWKIVVLAFIIFRIFDIYKPYPIKKLQKFNGGLGIIIDDFIAGIYSNLVIRVIIIFSSLIGLRIV